MLKVYAVLDKAVGAFLTPFFVRANGEAIRSFSDAVNDVQSAFYKHPNDFELYSICCFDPANGHVSDVNCVRLVAAVDLLNKM